MANKRRASGPTVADVISTLNDNQSKVFSILIAEILNQPVYVVTADGYKDSHGGEIYLIGVYNDKEKAQKVCEENQDWKAEVREITLNTTYPLIKKKDEVN